MNLSDALLTKTQLNMIVEFHQALLDTMGTQEFYTHLAEQLSRLAHRGAKPWSWRYVQSVKSGTLEPSEAFALAVDSYGATLDDVPAVLTYTVQVQVLARPGAIPPGTLILSEARSCAWPNCRVIFVPRVPWQVYCSRELHMQAERSNRKK